MTRLLALQGGGVLGYSQLKILIELEKRAGKPCWEIFDYIAGTSVGSIHGAALAMGIPAQDIMSFYEKSAPNIFHKPFLSSVGSLFRPTYGSGELEDALQELLGPTSTLVHCKTNFLATSYDVTDDIPVYFKSYEKGISTPNYIVYDKDSGINLWQICRASSAAQTYFPAYELNGKVLIDGGNTGDNAPDMLLLTEVLAQQEPTSEIEMLSLGTGDSKWTVDGNSMISPSLITAAKNTISIVFSAGEDSQIIKARKILGKNHYRISPFYQYDLAIDDASPQAFGVMDTATAKSISDNSDVLDYFAK